MLRRPKQYESSCNHSAELSSGLSTILSARGIYPDPVTPPKVEISTYGWIISRNSGDIARFLSWNFKRLVLILFILISILCLYTFYVLNSIAVSQSRKYSFTDPPSPLSVVNAVETELRVLVSSSAGLPTGQRRRHPKGKPSNPNLQSEVPVTDRIILDRLSLLSEPEDDGEDYRYIHPNIFDKAVSDRPPIITAVPEFQPTVSSLRAEVETYDTLFCGSYPCNLLLPSRIAEQESRARLHFMQILRLARELNRTLVLPNVADGRLGACYGRNFATYYDPGPILRERSNGRRIAITFDAYVQWAQKRPEDPTGQVVHLTDKFLSEKSGITSYETDGSAVVRLDDRPSHIKTKYFKCLKTRTPRANLSALPSFTVTPSLLLINDSNEEYPYSLTTAITEALISHSYGTLVDTDLEENDELEDLDFMLRDDNEKELKPIVPNILLLDWDLKKQIYSISALTPLNYSLRLSSFVSQVMPNSHKSLAVHWRMEEMSPEKIASCADILIRKLEAVANTTDEISTRAKVETVWFASDLSYSVISSDLPEAGSDDQYPLGISSFPHLLPTSSSRLAIVRHAFDQSELLADLRLLHLSEAISLFKQTHKKVVNGFDASILEDSGVLGIIDKIAASRAASFISAANDCGRISSFTRQIIDKRSVKYEEGHKDIRNIVDHFG